MKHKLIQSDDQSFYYLVAIDEENNETVLGQNTDLDKLRKEFPEAAKLKVVSEHETRGTVEVDDVGSQD